jgi:Trypsin-like peptidase domain
LANRNGNGNNNGGDPRKVNRLFYGDNLDVLSRHIPDMTARKSTPARRELTGAPRRVDQTVQPQSDLSGERTDLLRIRDAVIRVGDGRGFLVASKSNGRSVILTAAHCLPHLPPAHPASYTEERTYANLVGPLGEEPTTWTEALFVDPVADVAVLGAPNGQVFYDEWEAYEAFVEGRPLVKLAAVTRQAPMSLLTLGGQWTQCDAEVGRLGHRLTLCSAHIEAGMSGSPIVNRSGRAVGIVSVGSLVNGAQTKEQHGQPVLLGTLPGWLLAELWPQSLRTLHTTVAAQRRAWEQYLRRGYRQAKKRQND